MYSGRRTHARPLCLMGQQTIDVVAAQCQQGYRNNRGNRCRSIQWRARVPTDELVDLRLRFLQQLQQPLAHRPRRSRRLRLRIHSHSYLSALNTRELPCDLLARLQASIGLAQVLLWHRGRMRPGVTNLWPGRRCLDDCCKPPSMALHVSRQQPLRGDIQVPAAKEDFDVSNRRCEFGNGRPPCRRACSVAT